MDEPAAGPSPRKLLTWWVVTLLLAGVALALFVASAMALWDGQLKVTYRSGRTYLVTAGDSPVEFLFRCLVGLGSGLLFGRFAWMRLDTWRNRHGTGRKAFEAQVAKSAGHTSKAGNVMAWILAIPFILLALVVLLGMILKALGKI